MCVCGLDFNPLYWVVEMSHSYLKKPYKEGGLSSYTDEIDHYQVDVKQDI